MGIIVSQRIHYRCVIDIAPGDDGAWGKVVRRIREWIGQRTDPNDAFGRAWFFTGGLWRPAGGRDLVETKRFVGLGSDAVPDAWSCRFEHPCDEHPRSRLWRTDFGLARLGDRKLRLSLVVTHSLRPGFMGEEPPTPAPTTPAIVRLLVGDPSLVATAGNDRLSSNVQRLRTGDGKDFFRMLEDPFRTLPVIFASNAMRIGLPSIDCSRLARRSLGAAIVVEAGDATVDEELQHLIPKDFRCWDGAVRVYMPGLRFDQLHTARQHRTFLREWVDGVGAQGVEEIILRGLALRTSPLLRDALTTLDDVDSMERERRLAELRDQPNHAEQREWVDLLESDNAALRKKLTETGEQAEAMAQRSEAAETEKGEVQEQLAIQRAELETWKSRALGAEQNVRNHQRSAEALHQLATLPESLPDIIAVIGGLFCHRIVFTERARRSAQESSIDRAELKHAWRCLYAMATTLYDLHFGETEAQASGSIVERFQAITGFELTLTEGSSTKKDKRLMEMRQDDFDGTVVDITPHVKHGKKSPKLLRVHYCPLHEKRLLVVGHCGDHMETVGTSRRGF